MNPGPWGILIIVVAVLLLFGRGKIAGMMGEVANGIKAFQKGLKGEDEVQKIDNAVDNTIDVEPKKEKQEK